MKENIINDYQKEIYANWEYICSNELVDNYISVLEKFNTHNVIKILDIGGCSGYFAAALYKYFVEKKCNCEITVLDNAVYDTWNRNNSKITFIEGSANDIEKLFDVNTYDLIFANRVFHHFVKDTWESSINSINDIMRQIKVILKNDGYFCITDFFYDGYFVDSSASKIIYKLTSCKNPLLVKIFRKIESNSAGIGVCFLSKKLWLNFFKINSFKIETITDGDKFQRSLFRILIYKIF